MVELLTAYESFQKMYEIMEELIGPDLFQGGAFEGLSHLDTLLAELSPLYNRTENYEEQDFSRILEDPDLHLQEKAQILLAGQRS